MTTCTSDQILLNGICLIDTCSNSCNSNGTCVQSTLNPSFAVCSCVKGYDPTDFCFTCNERAVLLDSRCVYVNCGDSCSDNGICQYKKSFDEFRCVCSGYSDPLAFCSQCIAGSQVIDGSCQVVRESMDWRAQLGICLSVGLTCGVFCTIAGVSFYSKKYPQRWTRLGMRVRNIFRKLRKDDSTMSEEVLADSE